MKPRKLPKTLDACWKLTIAMWKDIATAVALTDLPVSHVGFIKDKWLAQHGFTDFSILNSCFFCEWAEIHGFSSGEPNIPGGCPDCPATKVDPEFHCQSSDCHWAQHPIKMYKRFVALNKKRLAKRRKK